ncbi:MAG: GNAT family N-acetyltransferase [Elusimicrobiaceae bacterium]|jgi:hypothetical protein
MTRADLDVAVDWAAREGWNPGLADAERFYNTDPGGFFMAFRDGKPVGAISAVKYGETFGFIGFFIVTPGLRGGLIGVKLGKMALAYLAGRTIGIDGVLNKVKNYKFFGFSYAYNNARYEGTALEFARQNGIVDLNAVSHSEIVRYDSEFFPEPRASFILDWIKQPGGAALGILENGKLSAMGVARKCRTGYKIGPLFAENADYADRLFQALVSRMEPGRPYYLDIPEINANAEALVNRYGLKKVFATARMYKNGAPDLPLVKIFGITSFELG